MKDVLATYTGNNELLEKAFKLATIDDEMAEILANVNKLPAVKIINDRGKGYYDRIRSAISANDEITFLHEFGHSLDFGIIKASSKGYGNFSKTIATAVEQHRIRRMNKFPETVSNKFRELKRTAASQYGVQGYKKLKEEGWNAVSDIFDALTNGNMFGKDFSIAGHGAKYYRMNGMKEKEIFAQYVRLRMNNCTEALSFLKENVPDLLKSLDESFTLYVKELKEL